MHHSRRPKPDEVEQLLRNAELRDELERYFDESISRVNVQQWTLAAENEFLASMLAWEQAPILPIYRWFEPELRLPRPESLSDGDLHQILGEVIRKLYAKRIVLDFTDHLSDRELYRLIYRDILPAREKKLDYPSNYLHWDCTGAGGDPRSGSATTPARRSGKSGPRAIVSRCRRRSRRPIPAIAPRAGQLVAVWPFRGRCNRYPLSRREMGTFHGPCLRGRPRDFCPNPGKNLRQDRLTACRYPKMITHISLC